MKRLFCVRRKALKISVLEDDNGDPLYFRSKVEAKQHRDKENAQTGEQTYVVSLGPDHRRFRQQVSGHR